MTEARMYAHQCANGLWSIILDGRAIKIGLTREEAIAYLLECREVATQ